jgi:hypothetical protein
MLTFSRGDGRPPLILPWAASAFSLVLCCLHASTSGQCMPYGCFDENPSAACENDSIVAIVPCNQDAIRRLQSLICQGRIRLVNIEPGILQAGHRSDVRTHDAAWLSAQFPAVCQRTTSQASIDEITDQSAARLYSTSGKNDTIRARWVLVENIRALSLGRQEPYYTSDDTFYDRYHVTEDMRRRWEDMAQRSDLVRKEVIGRSWEGQEIVMIRIGRTDPARPVRVLVNGLQHAREWAALMGVTYFADQMTRAVSNVSSVAGGGFNASLAPGVDVRKLLDGVELLVIPMVNPDGYNHTRTDRFWRKNRRRFDRVTAGCVGVDLNRNWPLHYGYPGSTSDDPCSDVYIGSNALSEPEASTLARVITNTGDGGGSSGGLVGHLDVHTYGGHVLGPWAYSQTEAPPGAAEWEAFGSDVAAGVLAASGSRFNHGTGDKGVLYEASGVMSDWTYSLDMRASATLELDPVLADWTQGTKAGFDPPTGEPLRRACASAAGAGIALLVAAAAEKQGSSGAPRSRLALALGLGLGLGLVAAAVLAALAVAWVCRRFRRAGEKEVAAGGEHTLATGKQKFAMPVEPVAVV